MGLALAYCCTRGPILWRILPMAEIDVTYRIRRTHSLMCGSASPQLEFVMHVVRRTPTGPTKGCDNCLPLTNVQKETKNYVPGSKPTLLLLPVAHARPESRFKRVRSTLKLTCPWHPGHPLRSALPWSTLAPSLPPSRSPPRAPSRARRPWPWQPFRPRSPLGYEALDRTPGGRMSWKFRGK